MLIPNIAAMVSKAMGVAQQALDQIDQLQTNAPDLSWHSLSITPQNCNLQYSYVRACYSSGARLLYMTFGILSATQDRDVIVVRTPLPSGFSLAINDSELGALTKSGDNTVAENQMAGFLVRQNGNYLEIVETSTNPSGWAKATIMLPLVPA